MEPMTMMAILAALGGTIKGFSEIFGGRQEEKAYRYNAQLAMQQGKLAKRMAAARARMIGERGRVVQGRQRSLMAKSGAQMISPSFRGIRTETATKIGLDIATALYEGKVGMASALSKSNMLKWQGKMKKRAGLISGLSTILTSLAGSAVGGAGSTATSPPGISPNEWELLKLM